MMPSSHLQRMKQQQLYKSTNARGSGLAHCIELPQLPSYTTVLAANQVF